MPKRTESTNALDAVRAVMTKADLGKPVTRDDLMQFMGAMITAHKVMKQRLERVERQLTIYQEPASSDG